MAVAASSSQRVAPTDVGMGGADAYQACNPSATAASVPAPSFSLSGSGTPRDYMGINWMEFCSRLIKWAQTASRRTAVDVSTYRPMHIFSTGHMNMLHYVLFQSVHFFHVLG